MVINRMSTQKNKRKTVIKPAEKIKEEAHEAARAATAAAPVRRYRAGAFLIILLIISTAFAVLTFLVKTTPSFPLDLQVTRGIQAINIPVFEGLMVAVSWQGFWPQSGIITGLIFLLILGFGLQWEALG